MIYLTYKKRRAVILIFCLVSLGTFLLRDPSFLLSPFQNIVSGSCGCPSCMWHPGEEDAWFSERFNLSVHPLLSVSNSELSDDTYKWWLVSTSHCVYSFVLFMFGFYFFLEGDSTKTDV